MIKSKKDLKMYLQLDLEASGLKSWHALKGLKYPILHWQRKLRKLEYAASAYRHPVFVFYISLQKFFYQQHSIKLGFTIPLNVFGPGLSIAHWGTIVVDEKSKVGKNCRIHPGTIMVEEEGRAPTLGDDCYIGLGAKLLGGVILGNKVTVGANSVVSTNFPDDAVIVGVPARNVQKQGAILKNDTTTAQI